MDHGWLGSGKHSILQVKSQAQAPGGLEGLRWDVTPPHDDVRKASLLVWQPHGMTDADRRKD